MNMDSQKIVTFLTYNNQAKEAVKFYTGIFKDSKILSELETEFFYVAGILLHGQEFTLMNAGPSFKFEMGFSLVVKCDSQDEIDYFWEKLSEGGEKSQCGWLRDKFGVSWQVVSPKMIEMFMDKNIAKAQKAMQAMMTMSKIVMSDIEAAFNEG
jgi:predicted 3-demethylubiquinone-9 3-methyltransferase (glyoxalase superfamily)